MLRKITCNRTRKIISIKEKVSLYFNQITFSYNQWLHLGSTQYKQFPQKKKKDGRSLCGRKGKRENEMWKKRRKEERENEKKEKERKEVEKRRRRKGMERVCAEGKGKGRMRCGRKEEKKEKEKKGEEEKEE